MLSNIEIAEPKSLSAGYIPVLAQHDSPPRQSDPPHPNLTISPYLADLLDLDSPDTDARNVRAVLKAANDSLARDPDRAAIVTQAAVRKIGHKRLEALTRYVLACLNFWSDSDLIEDPGDLLSGTTKIPKAKSVEAGSWRGRWGALLDEHREEIADRIGETLTALSADMPALLVALEALAGEDDTDSALARLTADKVAPGLARRELEKTAAVLIAVDLAESMGTDVFPLPSWPHPFPARFALLADLTRRAGSKTSKSHTETIARSRQTG